jgi:hypothetical protein
VGEEAVIAWLLGNLTETLALIGAVIAALVGLRWKWRRDGAKAAKDKMDKKDRDHAEDIRDRVARADDRVRQHHDAGWRD